MDVKSQLVTVGEVQMLSQIATAFSSLQKDVKNNRDGQSISIKVNGGYMSSYDVLKELVDKVDVDTILDPKFRQQINTAKESYESFVQIATGRNAKLFEDNMNALEKKNFLSAGEPYMFYEEVVQSDHPFLEKDTKIYGIPNRTTVDPRRTGIFIALNPISVDLFLYLKQVAPKYGFIWYGINTTYWLYVNAV